MNTQKMTNNKTAGFTLIELMITIVIIAILASIAYPTYQDTIRKAHREEAKRTLLEGAQYLENYYAMNLTYGNAINTSDQIIGFTLSSEFSNDYELTATSAGANTYLLVATPKTGSIQANDSCGTLSINNHAFTTPTTSGCW